MDSGPAGIDRLRSVWQAHTVPSGRIAALAVCVALLLGAAFAGRLGTSGARLAGFGLLLLGLILLAGRAVLLWRRYRDPGATMRTTVLRTEPALGRAALRALRLTRDTAVKPQHGSAELAGLHLSRLLGRVSLDQIARRAGRWGWAWAGLALGLAAVAVAVVLPDPFRVVEGLDVLVAKDQVAPLPLGWLEGQLIEAHPPAYLGQPERPLRPYFPTALPNGSVITMRGTPRHDGRQLVLTDGTVQVPFADDGGGGVVARWQLQGDTQLRVAAQFGEVLVPEPKSLDLHCILDHPPHVRLEGAPKTIRLLEQPRIPIHWEAIDDHGLTEVWLSLRSGELKERRRLSKPKGGVRLDRGGIELRSDDKLLKQSFLPTEILVEARDNDPLFGPKWGRSRSIIVVPPKIGEQEALRYAALARARDALTDLLAERLSRPPPKAEERAEHLAFERRIQQQHLKTVSAELDRSFGGLPVRGRLKALFQGQLERLQAALEAEQTGQIGPAHSKLVELTESALLAVDSGLGALGFQDSRETARKLSAVAAEIARIIAVSRTSGSDRSGVEPRLKATTEVLADGGEQLVIMGELGQDLGEIVRNGLRRIRRGWQAKDAFHAQLAAEDLAARLREPDPSFSGGGGGVEASGPPRPGEGPASEAAAEAAALYDALEQLRQEHAAEMQQVQQALDNALSPEQKNALQQQLQEQAKKVREAIDELPRSAQLPDSARAEAATARSFAEAMAGALEKGDLQGAVEAGKQAMESLRAAERLAREPESLDADIARRAQQARAQLAEPLEWAEEALKQLGQHTSDSAMEELQESAKREEALGKRAAQLQQLGAEGEVPLPQALQLRLGEAGEAMREAAELLRRGQGQRGLERQRDAQRLLEMAQPETEQPSDGNESDQGRKLDQEAEIPKAQRDKRADQFRERVSQGLKGRVPPDLRDALRRYTEGLLR